MEDSKLIRIEEDDFQTNEIKIETAVDIIQNENAIVHRNNKTKGLLCELCNKRCKN